MENLLPKYPSKLTKKELKLLDDKFEFFKDEDGTLDPRKFLDELDKTDANSKCPLGYEFLKSLDQEGMCGGLDKQQFIETQEGALQPSDIDNLESFAEGFFEEFFDKDGTGYVTKDQFFKLWDNSSVGRTMSSKSDHQKVEQLFFNTTDDRSVLSKEDFVSIFNNSFSVL